MGEGPAQSEPQSFADPSPMGHANPLLHVQAVARRFLILTRLYAAAVKVNTYLPGTTSNGAGKRVFGTLIRKDDQPPRGLEDALAALGHLLGEESHPATLTRSTG